MTTETTPPDPTDPDLAPGDEAHPGTEGTGDTLCPHCDGSGRDEDGECSVCGGNGRVNAGVGGG